MFESIEDADFFEIIEDNWNVADAPSARTTLLGATQQTQVDKRFGEMAIWEALLRQAEANREQAEALRANSHAILAHTQRVIHA